MVRRCRLLVLGLVVGALTSLAPSAAGAGTGALLGTGDSIAFGTNRFPSMRVPRIAKKASPGRTRRES